MSKVEWVDLSDIYIEQGIMSVIGTGGTFTAAQIAHAYSRAGFKMPDDHLFIHFISQLVSKGYLRTQREGRYDYYWIADRSNSFRSSQRY